MALLALVPSLIAGWLVAHALLSRERGVWALEGALAFGLAAGWASIVMFLARWGGFASPAVLWGLDGAAIVGGLALCWVNRSQERVSHGDPLPRFAWWWAIGGALSVCGLLFVASSVAAWKWNPYGDFDAFSVWNLRARFLVSAEGWRFAVIPRIDLPMFGATHTGYPLLLSGFVAHLWMLTGSTTIAVPFLVSVLFTLSVVVMLAGAVSYLRGRTAGLLAALVLLATDGFLLQSPKQYADVPVTLYILGTVAFAAMAYRRAWDSRLLAASGICAGLALWTKSEAQPVVLVLGAVLIWLARRRMLPFVWGLLPGFLVMLVFRLGLAPSEAEITLPQTLGGYIAQLISPGRWWAAILGFLQAIWELGPVFAHPVLMVAILAFVLRRNRQDDRFTIRWFALPIVALLAADVVAMVLTTSDQAWHISTAVNRLTAQLWPPALLIAFWAMGRPEDYAETIAQKGKRAKTRV